MPDGDACLYPHLRRLRVAAHSQEYVDLQVLCDKHRPAEGGKKKRKRKENKW